MFKKILVAQDGSDGSARVLPLAVAMAEDAGAEIVIAHIDEQTTGKGGGSLNALDRDLREQLEARANELTANGVATSFECRSIMVGGPAHVLAEIADSVGADLIVAGTRGHSPLSGLVLGSVAQRLLHVAHQPVLLVPESADIGKSLDRPAMAAAGA
jgi:nucleotide-binding universal stress UspA family protein